MNLCTLIYQDPSHEDIDSDMRLDNPSCKVHLNGRAAAER